MERWNKAALRGAAHSRRLSPRAAAVPATLLAAGLALAGCANTNVPADGFKDIHYGMGLADLRRMGFNCRPDQYVCRRNPGSPQETLFGKAADVTVETRGGAVVKIEANVDLPLGDTLSMLRQNFGASTRREGQSDNGQRIGIYYWGAGNGSSITVPDLGAGARTVVQFNNASITRELFQVAPVSQVDPHDI